MQQLPTPEMILAIAWFALGMSCLIWAAIAREEIQRLKRRRTPPRDK